MPSSVVSISEQAFFTVVTAALEAYRVDQSEKQDGSSVRLETFGHLWGYESVKENGEAVYRVVLADVSTSAHRTSDFVISRDGAYSLKSEFVGSFFPELSFIGDFHSHPYSDEHDGVRTELELQRRGLYQFSPSDFRAAKADQESGRNYRVGLVVTVFERNLPVSRSSQYLDGSSCIRFQYDSMTLWIKAYVWYGDEFRRNSDKMVSLICPSLGFCT